MRIYANKLIITIVNCRLPYMYLGTTELQATTKFHWTAYRNHQRRRFSSLDGFIITYLK